MRTPLQILRSVAAVASLLAAQQPPPVTEHHARSDALLALARTAAPEFQAHVLLRLHQEAKPPSREQALEQIEDAFRLASLAPEPLALQQVFGGTNSVSGALRQAFPAGLDAVSLRLRAAEAMLAYRPARALEMFEEIQLPDLPARSCADHLTYDLSRYYEVLGRLADAAFPAKERSAERHVEFIAGPLSRLSHASEVVPAIALLGKVRLLPPERERLVRIFAGRLEQLPPDSRSISGRAALLVRRVSDFVATLPAELRTQVVTACRAFVVNHLAADRCPDVMPAKAGSAPDAFSGEGRRLADYYNDVLLPKAGGTLAPVTARMETGKLLAGGPSDEIFDTGRAQELYSTAVVVLLKTEAAAKETREWRRQAETLLDAVVAWSGKDEPDPVKFYLAKATLLRLFVTTPLNVRPFEGRTRAELDAYLADQSRRPEFADRGKVQELLIEFLQSASADAVYQKRRMLWYAPVHWLIESEWRSFRGDVPALIALLERSRNPVLALEGRLLEARYRKNLP